MPKKIIICADGTWNEDENKDAATNVLKIAQALLPSDSEGGVQVVHYEKGVGTGWGSRFTGGALGMGLFDNAVSCYEFLCHNFQPGDRLYLFGFSWGGLHRA